MTRALVFSAVGGILAGLSGCGGATSQPATPLAAAPGDKDCCKGRNECKNQGWCKTDKGDCRGKNECKGQGGCQNPDCAYDGDAPPGADAPPAPATAPATPPAPAAPPAP